MSRVTSRTKKLEIFSPVWIGLLCCLLSAPVARADAGALNAFIHQYLQIQSLHFDAKALIHLPASGSNASGLGSFSYWEQNRHYRYSCRTDPSLGFTEDADIAYDGADFQYLVSSPDGDTLWLSVRELPEHMAAMPNPFFLPLEFMRPTSFECDRCRVTLSMLPSDLSSLESRAVIGQGEGSEKVGKIEKIEFLPPADSADAQRYLVHLSQHGGMTIPSRIDVMARGGRLAGTITLSDYGPAGDSALILPWKISLRSFDDAGTVTARMEVLYTDISVNAPVPLKKSTFTLPRDEDTVVWDVDTGTKLTP